MFGSIIIEHTCQCALACYTALIKEVVLQNLIESSLGYLVTRVHHCVNPSGGFNVSETEMRDLKVKNVKVVIKLRITRH